MKNHKKSKSKLKPNSPLRIITIISITIIAAIVLFVAYMVLTVVVGYILLKINQVKPEEANKVCKAFYEEVKSDIKAVPGYTIVNSQKHCSPSEDEAGFTDYYFSATFKIEKAGIDSVDGMRAGINYLSVKLPIRDYPLWVDNVPGKNGQPDAMCVHATMQIQENGDEYQSMNPAHYPRYIEPDKFNKDFTGSCSDL